jgi:beta-lactam-binding protein with PASTA domain
VLRQGSVVIVEISSGEAEAITLIDLRGLKQSEVSGALNFFSAQHGISVGWGLVEVVTSNPALHGIVVSTNPAPGSPVNDGDVIEVRIGRAP